MRSGGGAGAALDVEYDEVVSEVRGVEVRVRLGGEKKASGRREEGDVDGRGHPHHRWGGTGSERLKMGKQLSLDEFLQAA